MFPQGIWPLTWLNSLGLQCSDFGKRTNLPSLRYLPKLGVFEAIGEEVGDFFG